jgi:hypothetical protein
MRRYRCEPGTSTWHTTTECSTWPVRDYWSHSHMPHGAEVCAECTDKTGSASSNPQLTGELENAVTGASHG